ncbi:ketopantoate reductase family protein [Aspergillus stella-maris]|uniref:ketopantoate reductase family protein n=1 Tax=Aspergillus stella-maris TaxID=1810926 RepID=UPI003CCE098B
MASPDTKANILLFGSGAVGTIAALNIECGGLGEVTAVLRSNYQIVQDRGYTIDSVDHGKIKGWRPSHVVNSVPDVAKEGLPPFDYIVTTTKNCPDISPTLAELIAPAATPGHTVVVMIQNGLNLEKAMFDKLPNNIVLSGVSRIDSYEGEPGHIVQESRDKLELGPFRNPNIADPKKEIDAAHEFIKIYSASGQPSVTFSADVPWSRWRKLVYNAVLNPLAAISGLDSSRLRLSGSIIEELARPAMEEVVATAKALGHDLPEDIVDSVVTADPIDLYLKPSMLCDSEKGNFMEVEYLVGEPVREAQKAGVPTPHLKSIYEMCKLIQWRTMEAKGLVTVPPRRGE